MEHSLRLTVHPFAVRTAAELEAALREALERRPDAIAVVDTPLLATHRPRIVEFVAKHRLPSVSLFSGYPESEFLMSYGTSISQVWRRAAHYVDRLLKGAKPAELPVERPTKYELVVNLRTAKALGLTIPPSNRGLTGASPSGRVAARRPFTGAGARAGVVFAPRHRRGERRARGRMSRRRRRHGEGRSVRG
jgi:ABC-type uncharacterized transport system substrate-binding protein